MNKGPLDATNIKKIYIHLGGGGLKILKIWRILKAISLKLSDLHLSLIKCKCCWKYDDNLGPKIKKKSLVILGA